MDFASEYVVRNYDEEIEESSSIGGAGSMEVQDDSDSDSFGYEACVMEFDEDDDKIEQGLPVSKTGPSKISSNTVSFPMKVLIEEPAEKELASDQMIQCKGNRCEAILSHIDKPEGEKTWKCQFCGHSQELDNWPVFDDKQDILYIDTTNNMEPMEVKKIPLPDDDIVIFVIDISGSMSLQVKGSEGISKLRFSELSELQKKIVDQDFAKALSLSQLPHNSVLPALMDQTAPMNLTRLQTVKAGLIEQLWKMPQTKRVGLISFSTGVCIHGDCTGEDKICGVETDTMTYDQLKEWGKSQAELKPLSNSLTKMEEKILNLNDDGQTALGPALSVAVAMAKAIPGSKVILCTDGVANFGLGKKDADLKDIKDFYDGVSLDCRNYGVAVSVVSFDDCGLADRFGEIPKETGGQIEKVNCGRADFQKKLEEDLKHPTYATEVQTRFSVHKDMYILDSLKPDEKANNLGEYLGNINMTSKPCFRFAYKPVLPKSAHAPNDATAKRAADNSSPASNPPGPQTTPPPNPSNTNGTQGMHKEATPFSNGDNRETTPEQDANKRNDADDIEVETADAAELPFQYEVSFTLRNGLKGIRVWTMLKPVTTSIAKAQDYANIQAQVNNFLQESAKSILSKSNNKRVLISCCTQAMKECDDLKSKCENDDKLMKKLVNFHGYLKIITNQRFVNDDIANYLRKLQMGQEA